MQNTLFKLTFFIKTFALCSKSHFYASSDKRILISSITKYDSKGAFIKKQLSITIYERENAFFKIAQIPQS